VIALALVAGVWFWRYESTRTGIPAKEHPPTVAETNALPGRTTPSGGKAFASMPDSTPASTAVDPEAKSIATTDVVSDTNTASFISRTAQNVFEIQLALARQAISPGSLDGVPGPKTRLAVMAFQQKEGLPATGDLDLATKNRLLLTAPPLTNYTVTSNDLARLRPLGKTWLEKSQQDQLDYETVIELVAEKAESHPNLLRGLNPAINWTNVTVGTIVTIPGVERARPRTKAAFARIHLESRCLQAFDERTNLVAHFPCSIAAFAEKRPVGELHVATVASNPNYTFDPENFPESAEARELKRKLILPPGPNNPVGTVWIGLDKPGYGIHGTPRPEQVGRAESHGCFRLANWNAEYFSQLTSVGMPVFVEP
jgi:lipoprotein-anchoring transpeptidase ErfK/SrfK